MIHKIGTEENHEGKNIKLVFIAGGIYFTCTTIFSLCFYKEKFILDGYGQIFEIANFLHFPDANQREVKWFCQIIPLLFAKFGFSLKSLLIAYILNTYLFHFILFSIIALWLRDFTFSLLFLFVHMFGQPYSYYLMVGELMPGVSAAILTVALVVNERKVDFFNVLLTSAMTLLVVRSHPLAIICLCSALVFLFVERSVLLTREKIRTGIILTIISLGLFFKFSSLNNYDISILEHRKSLSDNLLQLTSPSYTIKIFSYLLQSNPAFTLILIFTTVCLIYEKRFRLIIASVIVTAGCIIMFNSIRDFSNFHIWDVLSIRNDSWSLPVRFIVFFVFFMFCLKSIFPGYERKVLTILVLLLFSGWYMMVEITEKAKITTHQDEEIIHQARKNGFRKVVVDIRKCNVHSYLQIEAFFSSLVLSSLNSADSTVHVVYADSDSVKVISERAASAIELMTTRFITNQELNHDYFNLPDERYKYLIYSPATTAP